MEISNFRTKPNRLKRRLLKKRAMFVRDRCVNINTFIFALAILRARANTGERGGREETRNTSCLRWLQKFLTRFPRITSHLVISTSTRGRRQPILEKGSRSIDRSKAGIEGREAALSGDKGGIYHWASLPRPDNKRHALCTQSKVQGRDVVRVVRMPFPGGVQGGVPPFIDARPIDNPDKLAGKDSIEREREARPFNFQSNKWG